MSMKGFAIAIVAEVLIVMVGLGFQMAGYEWDTFTGTMENKVRRESFKESQSYVEGKIQTLVKYQYEYEMASPEEKQIIANVIRQQFADFDSDELNYNTKQFYNKIFK